jgi:predicted dehydrogenase
MGERIRWGIAGTGVIAHAFAMDLALLPNAELVAVGSRSQASADAFADGFGIPHRHVGYDALAADPHVDAVYVAVPHTRHEEVALTAIAAGKAVLVEKPFAVNALQAERMIEAARTAGVFLMEAMWVRFLPHQIALREMVADGRAGPIRSLIVDRGEVLSADPRHRVMDPALAGGALLDLGVYPVSFASMLLGTPDRVAALSTPTVTGVDAQTSMVFGYPSGAQALINTALDARTANTASITCANGRIDMPHWTGGTLPLRFCKLDGSSQSLEYPYEGKGLRFQAEEVARRMHAGETQSPVIPLDETLSIMRTLDLVRQQIGLRYPFE